GSYAGNLSTGIICAGGAQFENGTPPWNSGVKVWTDRIFYLSDEKSSWKEMGKLPFKCGYGASASYKGRFYIAGGSNQSTHLKGVLEITLVRGHLEVKSIAELPVAVANCSFSQHENFWYILGGQQEVDSKTASNK